MIYNISHLDVSKVLTWQLHQVMRNKKAGYALGSNVQTQGMELVLLYSKAEKSYLRPKERNILRGQMSWGWVRLFIKSWSSSNSMSSSCIIMQLKVAWWTQRHLVWVLGYEERAVHAWKDLCDLAEVLAEQARHLKKTQV